MTEEKPINLAPSLHDLLGGSEENPLVSAESSKKESSSSQNFSLETLISASPSSPSAIGNSPSLEDLLSGVVPAENGSASNAKASFSVNVLESVVGEKKQKDILTEGFVENENQLLSNIEQFDEGLHLDESHEEIREEDPEIVAQRMELKMFEKEILKRNTFLMWAQGGLVFSVIFGVISFLSFSLLLDTQGAFGNILKENYGHELLNAQEKKTELEKYILDTKTEIKKVEKIIAGLENNELLDAIVKDRIDWLKAIDDIEKVRDKARVSGDSDDTFIFQNYTTRGKTQDGKTEIVVQGMVQSSTEHVFQKMARLVESFNSHENFENAEIIKKFVKNADARFGYSMPFNLRLTYYRFGKTPKTEEKKEKTTPSDSTKSDSTKVETSAAEKK